MSRVPVLPIRLSLPGVGTAAALLFVSAGKAFATQADPAAGLLTLCLATLPEMRPEAIWSAWSLAPAIVLPIALAGLLYARGWRSVRLMGETQQPRPMQASLFAAGIGCLVLALMSPLCRMASTLASAHMVQHVLLVAGAPLLLALSRPGRVLMDGLPARIRKRAAVWTGAPSVPPRPAFLLVSFLLYGVNIWFWHVPALYEAALLDAGMHLTMVCALLITSLLFWHAILATYRVPGTASATAAMLLFFTFLHTGALGIFLTLAPRIWYPLVALRSTTWDILPLDDQRLAGLIMWIPMGGIYFVAGLAILARLISSAGRMSQEEARG